MQMKKSRMLLASKMSMEGWWMVQTTVRPVFTVLRTVLMTMAAALASSPALSTIRFDIISQQHTLD